MDAPKTFRTTIEQVDAIDDDGSHVHTEEIVTDGDAYLEDCWDDLTVEQKREHDAWVEEMHDAEVALAEALPNVRALAQRILDDKAAFADWPGLWAQDAQAALKRAKKIVRRPDYPGIVETVRADLMAADDRDISDDAEEAWLVLGEVAIRENAAREAKNTEARV